MNFYSILALVFLIFLPFDGNNCPPKGDSNRNRLQVNDSLKNRNFVGTPIVKISWDSVLLKGDDTKRFSPSTYASITGYVFDVKYGGPETCNCHSADKSQLDIHIELLKDLNDFQSDKRMIIEINRFTRNDSDMSYETVRLLRGKKVEIEGWMFFDDEHKQNAINTSPNGTNVWRATCWEIHPCMSIKEIK